MNQDGLLHELTNLSYQRSTKQALAFYGVTFLTLITVAFIIAMVVGLIVGVEHIDESKNMLQRCGILIAFFVSTGLSIEIIRCKKLKTTAIYGAVLGTALLALFGGALLGLIPVAWLTTKPKAE